IRDRTVTGVQTCALPISRASRWQALRAGRWLAVTSARSARATLVITEVALALMLLVSATLVARSLVRLLSVDPGFDASHLLALEVNASGVSYPDNARVFAHHDRVR